MIRRPPRSTQSRSSAASDVYKRQLQEHKQITVEQYSRIGFLPYARAEETLVNLVVMGIAELKMADEGEVFVLNPNSIQ